MTPAPSLRHQQISARLFAELRRLLEEPGLGTVLYAPLGVEFPGTDEGVQPDIVFVSRARSAILVKEGIRGAPDLVVEIASPATADRDRTVKKKLYERHGAAAYWVVDPETDSLEVWDFAGQEMRPTIYKEKLPARIEGYSFGDINLPDIFPPEF